MTSIWAIKRSLGRSWYIYSTYISNIRYCTHIHVYTLPKTIIASEHGPSPKGLTPTISKHPIQRNLLTVVNSESLDGHGINALHLLLSTAELRLVGSKDVDTLPSTILLEICILRNDGHVSDHQKTAIVVVFCFFELRRHQKTCWAKKAND